VPKFDPNSVADLYKVGRTYGSKPHDAPNYPKIKGGLGEVDPRQQAVQDRESRSADPTFNDVPERSWLRGGAGPMYPGGLDRGLSGRRYGRRSEKG
jgi:hypothetical protein